MTVTSRTVILLTVVMFATLVHAEIRMQDGVGRTVVLAKPAQRIVSLAPHITEIVFAAGAGDQLVGAVSYSDYPEAAKEIPRIGSFDNISYESLIALNPDLVLVWRSGNGEEVEKRLEQLGLTIYVGEPKVLEDVAIALRHFGILSDNVETSEHEANNFSEKLARLKSKYSHQDELSVYYQIWHEPMMTLNGKHLLSDVIRLCGGVNVFADALPLVPRISVESVIKANPQVIIASGMDQARPEWLDDWRQWTMIDAVRTGQLYFVPPELLQRHTPRIIQGAAQVCEFLEKARASY